MIFAISVGSKPRIIELLLALPLAVIVGAAALRFLRGMELPNRRAALLVFAGVLFLPSVVLVRFTLLPAWKPIGRGLHTLGAGLPTVSILIFLTGVTCWLMARAACWNVDTRWLRRCGTVACVVAWTPIWIRLLEMSHGRVLVAIVVPAGVIGALAWIDHIVSPRAEDEDLPERTTNRSRPDPPRVRPSWELQRQQKASPRTGDTERGFR